MRRDRSLVLAVVVDAVAIALFAALGRRTHDEGSGVAAVLGTAAPFLIAAAAGWLIVLATRLEPMSTTAGVVIWVATVVGGLLLRRIVWDRGTAASFVVVAAMALGILIVGWRSVYGFATGRREVPSASPPSKAGR